MCACGCFVLAAAVGGIVYCAVHGLWLPGAAIIAASVAIAFFGKKYSGWRPPPRG
jgi:hypothetical protein